MAAAAGNISGGGQSCRRASAGGFPQGGITDGWQLCEKDGQTYAYLSCSMHVGTC